MGTPTTGAMPMTMAPFTSTKMEKKAIMPAAAISEERRGGKECRL